MATGVTIVAGYACYPFDTVGRRMMMQSGEKVKTYKNPIHCARTLVRSEGIKGIYGGSLSNAYRSVAASLILVLYDDLKKMTE